jgi:hypothetical protein
MNAQRARSHFRGEYIFNEKAKEEFLKFVTVPDFERNLRNKGVTIDFRATTNKLLEKN